MTRRPITRADLAPEPFATPLEWCALAVAAMLVVAGFVVGLIY